MLVYELRQDLLANDLANALTPGYRPKDAPVEAFPEVFLLEEVGGARYPRGPAGTGAYLERTFTRWSARGPLRPTGQPLDLAIEGDGFFVVETPEGPRLTRAGNFLLRADGVLTSPDGHPVLGTDGVIVLAGLSPVQVTVGPDGRLFGPQGERLGQLLVVDVPDREGLVAEGATLYRFTEASGEPARVEAPVHQGMLESSGTPVARTMAEMIAAVRAYQAAEVAVRVHDEATGQLIGTVGRVT